MPVLVDPAALGAYARFPGELDQDWVERTCHLSPADLDLVRRRADQVTRLGFAVQVVTVRAIGTFLPDPAAVPARVATAVARQLDATDARVLAGYRDLAVRWRHTAEIRTRYGYRDFTAQPGHFLLLACCTARPGPTTWPRRCCSGRRTAGCWASKSCYPARACWPGWWPRCGTAPPAGCTPACSSRHPPRCGRGWRSC